MKYFIASGLVLTMLTLLTACGGSNSSGSDGGTPAPAARVNWATTPKEFNPSTQDVTFQTDGMETLKLDFFSFKDDVEIVYTPGMNASTGYVRLFKVWKRVSSFGSISPEIKDKNLNLKNYGSYQCQIQTENGNITKLDGGCYVRIQVFLPQGSQLEVYNVGALLSKRFIAIDSDSFVKNVQSATWAKDKSAAIDDFLNSYAVTGKTPVLISQQLGKVIHEFLMTAEKMNVLTRLHTFVGDRETLGAMIDSEFNYFERNDARKVVGLPTSTN